MDVLSDPRWDQLPRLFAGELSENEAEALQRWIDASAERQEVVARLRELWELAGTAPRVWNVEAGLEAIQRRTAGEPGRVIARVGQQASSAAVRRPRRWMTGMVAAAAAVLVVAGGGIFWQVSSKASTEVQLSAGVTEFTTRRGQRLSLRLQDGTLVTLAPASTLRQPASYGKAGRILYLDGEASFVVTHDDTRPFAVHTAHAVVRDLGTRFVVRAYEADSLTDVVVAEGIVAVGRSDGVASTTALGADSLVLTQGQRARVVPGGTLQFTPEVALDAYLDWTEGRLTFSHTPLAEVVRHLGRWHDVDIRLADALTAARRLTASFGDESIDDVIHRIATSLDLDVIRNDQTLILRAR